MTGLSPNFHPTVIVVFDHDDVKRFIAGSVAVVSLLGARAAMRAPLPEPVRASASPAASSPEEQGKIVYREYGCALCHGAKGEGGFANANAETAGKVPGLLYVAEGYTRAELRQKILDGQRLIGKENASGPVPPFRMPGWRDRMLDQELGALVAYLFSLFPESKEEKW